MKFFIPTFLATAAIFISAAASMVSVNEDHVSATPAGWLLTAAS